ncbi:MAG: response regulator [Xenococcus sp. (in: cyanobacteria)]
MPIKEESLSLKAKQILLFSNTKDLRRIIQLSLEEIAGWQVFVADLNTQDFTLVTVTQPDVIILDTNLPNSDELSILQKMREYSQIQNIPIVLLTERIFNCDRKLYHSLGIASVIAKPCDMVTLATIISRRLNWNWHQL